MHIAIVGSGDPAIQIDHRDGDGLNNRRANMPLATVSGNQANQKKGDRGKSRYKGVSRRRDRKHWRAQIRVRGKNIERGSFRTERAAARAYDRLARRHFVRFARLNFPATH
jgi:AP2 domain